MSFREYQEFAGDPLRLPINGKIYEIPPVDAHFGLVMLDALGGDPAELEALTARQIWARLLGVAGDQMLADGVSWTAYDRAGLTALAEFNSGREVAEQVWESGLPPEALAAMVAALQQESTRSPSSVSGTKTPTRASSNTTKSPKATMRAPRKAKGSRGGGSSKTGPS